MHDPAAVALRLRVRMYFPGCVMTMGGVPGDENGMGIRPSSASAGIATRANRTGIVNLRSMTFPPCRAGPPGGPSPASVARDAVPAPCEFGDRVSFASRGKASRLPGGTAAPGTDRRRPPEDSLLRDTATT